MANFIAKMCAGGPESRQRMGKTVHGTGSVHPDWNYVGMAGAA